MTALAPLPGLTDRITFAVKGRQERKRAGFFFGDA